MGDLLLLAGNIGLYPPKLAMMHATDIVWQYKQVKANFNSVIRKACGNNSLFWQNLAKSAIIYITERADLTELLPLLQKDFIFLPEATVVVRVPVLPMNCLIEIELLCESKLNGNTLSCSQVFGGELKMQNDFGEIFYTGAKPQVNSHASAVPVLEIMDIRDPTKKLT